MLRPEEAVRSKDFLHVTRGTKGGRDRVVPLKFKVAVLKEAVRLLNPYAGSTMPHGFTKQQWSSHYYFVLKKHGITMNGLRVTSHGLRHQYLQQTYERLTGVAAPIKRTDERADRDTHLAAIQQVVEAPVIAEQRRRLLISRPTGPFKLKPRRRFRWNRRSVALAKAGGSKSHAAAALGISRQSLY